MKSILIVTTTLRPPGGGSTVGAWALQALSAKHDVTVLTWERVDLPSVDRACGTTLAAAEARFETIDARVRAFASVLPVPLALLQIQLLMRTARAMLPAGRFDAVGEIDRMMRDSTLREETVRDVAARADRFSEERFMAGLLEAVDHFGEAISSHTLE